MSAQIKVTDEVTRLVNEVVHKKVQLLVKDAPTVDAAPVVHGKDVYLSNPHHCEFQCSICGSWISSIEGGTMDGGDKFLYCPHCGAKMDGGAE